MRVIDEELYRRRFHEKAWRAPRAAAEDRAGEPNGVSCAKAIASDSFTTLKKRGRPGQTTVRYAADCFCRYLQGSPVQIESLATRRCASGKQGGARFYGAINLFKKQSSYSLRREGT
jgi:hypothetical protein